MLPQKLSIIISTDSRDGVESQRAHSSTSSRSENTSSLEEERGKKANIKEERREYEERKIRDLHLYNMKSTKVQTLGGIWRKY